MIEIPLFFAGPDDDVPSINPYKPFEIKEIAEELLPIINKITNDEIAFDPPVTEDLSIEGIIERTGDSLTNEATALAEMDDEVIESIQERMKREAEEKKDYFFDQTGVKHIKDASLDFSSLSKIVSVVDSVFGILCVDGLNDLDFDISFSTEGLKDLLNNGLFSFADCFLEKATTEGLFDVIQDGIVASALDIISSDSLSTTSWITDNLDPGVTNLLGNDFLNEVVDKYTRPPSQTSLEKELARLESNFEDITGDWFNVGIGFYSDRVGYTSNESFKRLEPFKNASEDSLELFESSEAYLESTTVALAYEVETELTNYSLARPL